MLRKKDIVVNGRKQQPNYRLQEGDEILFKRPLEERQKQGPKKLTVTFEVLFEDEDVLVVSKPPRLPVHGGSGIGDNTLINQVQTYLGADYEKQVSLIHRIDRDTSGIVLLGKHRQATVKLGNALREGAFQKTYLALLVGSPRKEKWTWSSELEREKQGRKDAKVHSSASGKRAVTHVQVKERFQGLTLVSCQIETGRMHQIRVQSKEAGLPLAGDDRYGDFAKNKQLRKSVGLKRQFLHAAELEFPHPRTSEPVLVTAPLPHDLQSVIHELTN